MRHSNFKSLNFKPSLSTMVLAFAIVISILCFLFFGFWSIIVGFICTTFNITFQFSYVIGTLAILFILKWILK